MAVNTLFFNFSRRKQTPLPLLSLGFSLLSLTMLSSLSSLAATFSRREGAAAMTASSAAFASVFIRPLSSSSSAAAEAAAEVSPSSAPPPSSSSTAATAKGVNYLKSGSDPVIPSNLPEWISEVSSAPPAAFELRRALEQSSSAKQGGEDGNSLTGFLGAEGTSRLLKLEARARIKERNSVKAKK